MHMDNNLKQQWELTTLFLPPETTDPPPIIDVFSGCGGLSLGFTTAGFTVRDAFDNWEPAVESYSANAKHTVHYADLTDPSVITRADVLADPAIGTVGLIGGPPCQDFSSSGKRKEGDRAVLTDSFARMVGIVQPEFFLMENVPLSQKSRAYASATACIREQGYETHAVVLDASLYGVPQKRKRLFTFGHRDKNVVDLFAAHIASYATATPTTVADWFGTELDTEHYYRHPRSYARRAVFSVREPSPTIRGVNRPIPAGYVGHPGDSASVDKARPLTTAERASIQTFPHWFSFCASRTNTEQMIGNAVPPKLAFWVARAVANALFDQ